MCVDKGKFITPAPEEGGGLSGAEQLERLLLENALSRIPREWIDEEDDDDEEGIDLLEKVVG